MNRNRGKMLLSGALLLGMIFSNCSLAMAETTTNSGSTYNEVSESTLGDAGNFAVFAKNLEVCCDMEGNIAASNVLLNGASIGLTSSVEGFKLSYIENFKSTSGCNEFLKQSGCTDTLVIGDNYEIDKDSRWKISNSGNTFLVSPINNVSNVVNIKDSNYKIDFNQEFKELSSKATQLNSMETGTVTISDKSRNGTVTCGSKVNVMSMSMQEYNKLNDFNIEIQQDATLVINLVDYNGQNLDNKVKINGEKKEYNGMAGNVLWNFGTYDSKVSISETSQGCILAPNAQVNINSTHNGNIIAETVRNTSGEIHKNDFSGTIAVGETDTPKTDTPKEETPKEETSVESEAPKEETPVTTETPSQEVIENPTQGEVVQTSEPESGEVVTPTAEVVKPEDGQMAEVVQTNPSVAVQNHADGILPSTGDKSFIVIASSLLLLSVGSAVCVMIYKRKRI